MRLSLTYEGVKQPMPDYDIYRKYKFHADNPTQAMKQLFDALDAKTDEDHHISDSVREADEQPAKHKPAAWTDSVKKQILGK
jgi:hypothetical protein